MAIWLSFGLKTWIDLTKNNSKPMMSTVNWPAVWTSYSNVKQSQKSTLPQTPVPQKQMMSYKVELKNPSTKYSWLEKEDEELLDSKLKETWLSWNDLDILREQAVNNFIQVKQAKAFLEDREKIRSQITSWDISLWDKTADNEAYKSAQFADIIRKSALSNWVKWVTSVDDKTIIDGVFKQKPWLQEDYQRYLDWELSISNLNRIMKWGTEVKWRFMNWLADNVAPTLQKWAAAIFWEDELKLYQEQNKWKTFKDVAMNDMWAFPSVAVWAASVPARQIANLLWWNWAKVDDVVDYLWVKKDWRFNAGKLATEIWLWAIETMAWMKLLNVWQLWAMLDKFPKLSKYIVKPVLEAVWFTATQDLTKWEVSSIKDYWINAWINFLTMGLWNAIKWKSISKWLTKAANNVNVNTTDEYIKATKELASDFSKPSPLNKLVDKVDDIIVKIDSDKWVVWKTLWDMRTKMKTISYSIDDAVSSINKSLKANNIWAYISKDKKWVYKVTSKITKDSGKMSVLNEITNALNEWTSKSLWIKNKMAALDKLNQDIIYTVKKQAQWSPLGNALAKASKWFSETIENTMNKYWFTKGEYAKLSELKNSIKALSSEWKASHSILSKVSWAGAPEDVKNILKQLKEFWYTTDDLFSEAIVANNVMKYILTPTEFQQAIKNAYPSMNWLLELWIKGTKWIFSKPVSVIRSASQWYNPWIVKWTKKIISEFWTLKAKDELNKND